jgi:membrane protease YdiL (CAAX protease family)
VSDLHLVSAVFTKLPWYTILYLFVFRTFLEEWFFRSFLVSRVGVFISSFIFALAHIGYGSIIELIGAFTLGFLLSKIYSINKNIFCTYIPHFIYNSLVLLLIM